MVEGATHSRMLDGALLCAAAGLHVIPVHSCSGGECSCKDASSCEHGGKHPRKKNPYKNATTDKETIRKWWSYWPDANVGILAGRASRVVVLDVDEHNSEESGHDTLEQLEHVHGSLPETYSERTPTNSGEHLFFRIPAGVDTRGADFGPGLHVIANGLVVMSPSEIDGRPYGRVNGAGMADCPRWLLERITAKPKRRAAALAGGGELRGQTHIPDDDALLAKAMKGKGREKFAALWAGDRSGYETPSEADQALLACLAFWTNRDWAQMDRLFRRSGMFREKWAKYASYRESSIFEACIHVTRAYTRGRVTLQRPKMEPSRALQEAAGGSEAALVYQCLLEAASAGAATATYTAIAEATGIERRRVSTLVATLEDKGMLSKSDYLQGGGGARKHTLLWGVTAIDKVGKGIKSNWELRARISIPSVFEAEGFCRDLEKVFPPEGNRSEAKGGSTVFSDLVGGEKYLTRGKSPPAVKKAAGW